jgi:hypothetical protein
MLRLLGLRIFEATSTDITRLGEEHGHRRGARMDRHAATRRLHRLAGTARTETATPTTSSPPTWPPAPDLVCVSRIQTPGDALH